MGKRKSRTPKPTPRKPAKLDTEFSCPFCNHRDAVACLIDRKERYAKVECRICNESYVTKAHPLTAPVDVYAEWIDACEDANEGVDRRRRCRPRQDYV
nr:unnamed protein product [Digitaria exilis]